MATFGRNQTAVPKPPTTAAPKLSKGKSKGANVPATDRRLRGDQPPERPPSENSSLSDIPLSPEMVPTPMPGPPEASGSALHSTDQPRPTELPEPRTGATATTQLASEDANTANLILAALLKVTQGQDVLLQHLQAMHPPQPRQLSQPAPLQESQVSAGPLPNPLPLPTVPAQQPPQLSQPAPLQETQASAVPLHNPPPLPMMPAQQPTFLTPTPAPSLMAGSFMPPTGNTSMGACSVQSLFPDIEESLLLAIGRHTLRPGQISKLDTRLRDKQVASNLEYDNGVLIHKERLPSSKDFPTFESLHYPLQRYFSILQAQVIASAPPSVLTPFIIGCNDYISLLNTMHLDYDWMAVLNYHFAVHAQRLSDMAQGNYLLWGKIDTECQNRYLVGHTRARTYKDRGSHKNSGDGSKTQTCNDFNFRTCFREKCLRLHKCRSCDSTDHGVSKCPKKSS